MHEQPSRSLVLRSAPAVRLIELIQPIMAADPGRLCRRTQGRLPISVDQRDCSITAGSQRLQLASAQLLASFVPKIAIELN